MEDGHHLKQLQNLGTAISHISIPGPTLASLLHLLTSSPSDCDGLLFGHLSSPPQPSLHDDDDPSSSSSPSPSLSITSFVSLSHPSSLSVPALRRLLLHSRPSPSHVVGYFSARRCTPLRPSMRERELASSLSRDLQISPFVFLLLTSSPSPNLALHTHDFRAYQLLPAGVLEPRSVSVANLGPGFRAHYGAFSPDSALPPVPCGRAVSSQPISPSETGMVDALAYGFGVERLRNMAGEAAERYTRELEELYGKMLEKLEVLARQVEESDARVGEQESKNMKLRRKNAELN